MQYFHVFLKLQENVNKLRKGCVERTSIIVFVISVFHILVLLQFFLIKSFGMSSLTQDIVYSQPIVFCLQYLLVTKVKITMGFLHKKTK